jgi:hypothetical protein
MDKLKAIEILQLLADGMHPVTGEQLDQHHLINEPDVIRALNVALGALSMDNRQGRTQQNLPERVGRPWHEDEDIELIAAFDEGIDLNDLAIKHQRTRGAIRSRLVRLGKIEKTDRKPGIKDDPQ